MIYREPGFLAVYDLAPRPSPQPPLPSVSSTGDTQEDGRAGGSGRGAESYVCKEAWSSISHSILSGLGQVVGSPTCRKV
jgi:hypothetical protein